MENKVSYDLEIQNLLSQYEQEEIAYIKTIIEEISLHADEVVSINAISTEEGTNG